MDQAMLRVTSGQTSPRMTGVLYCAAIGTCEGDAWELARAQEWALSLERWMASLSRPSSAVRSSTTAASIGRRSNVGAGS